MTRTCAECRAMLTGSPAPRANLAGSFSAVGQRSSGGPSWNLDESATGRLRLSEMEILAREDRRNGAAGRDWPKARTWKAMSGQASTVSSRMREAYTDQVRPSARPAPHAPHAAASQAVRRQGKFRNRYALLLAQYQESSGVIQRLQAARPPAAPAPPRPCTAAAARRPRARAPHAAPGAAKGLTPGGAAGRADREQGPGDRARRGAAARARRARRRAPRGSGAARAAHAGAAGPCRVAGVRGGARAAARGTRARGAGTPPPPPPPPPPVLTGHVSSFTPYQSDTPRPSGAGAGWPGRGAALARDGRAARRAGDVGAVPQRRGGRRCAGCGGRARARRRGAPPPPPPLVISGHVASLTPY